ncbi:MAG TPA: glycosyltransferase [Iamia sp.]|nr:glycosyltransferase [Iamia sp.]
MNVLLWHVHGSWTTAFVHGSHTTLLPVVPGRTAEGRGRARTWEWPAAAVEVTPEALADHPVDVVVVQRPEEEELARRWLGGRIPGRDVPLVWLEHNTPPTATGATRHPAADRHDLVLVHVTPTNALLWDTGTTPTTSIEHGVIDPGHRFQGVEAAAVAVVNEPARRGRAVGADLLPVLAASAPVDLFGMGVDRLPPAPGLRPLGDVPQADLFDEVAARRAYLHPFRWTSLGLALIEAMLLGLPVVALATTEVPEAVPPGAGVVSNRVDRLADALRRYVADPHEAMAAGCIGRAAALDRWSLDRFTRDWDLLLDEVTA